MDRRLAAPDVGVVHDVVVDQREGVEEFQRGPDVDDGLVLGVTAGTDERPMTEGGSETLAAGQDQRPQGFEWGAQRLVHERPPLDFAVEQGSHSGLGGRSHQGKAGWRHRRDVEAFGHPDHLRTIELTGPERRAIGPTSGGGREVAGYDRPVLEEVQCRTDRSSGWDTQQAPGATPVLSCRSPPTDEGLTDATVRAPSLPRPLDRRR